jgi:hypothetical protein
MNVCIGDLNTCVMSKVKGEPEITEETDSRNYNCFSGKEDNSLLDSLMTLPVQMKQPNVVYCTST